MKAGQLFPWIKIALIPALVLLLCEVGFSQNVARDQIPQAATSATDGGVKVHRKLFHRRSSVAKKLGGAESSTQREGKPFRKSKNVASKATENEGKSYRRNKGSKSLGREGRVFGRHNHFATRDRSSSAKKARGKKTLGLSTDD